jgi:hypothetical protein
MKYQNKYLLFIILVFIMKAVFANTFDSRCKPMQTDLTKCLQQEITLVAKSSQTLKLKHATYILNDSLMLLNNTIIDGNSAILKFKNYAPFNAVFHGESITNVTLKNMTIDGGGRFSESIFINPYAEMGKPNAIGFTNTVNGIYLGGLSSNIKIESITFINMHHGVYIDAVKNQDFQMKAENLLIKKSTFENIGKAAIFLQNVTKALIKENKIVNVQGNFSSGVMPSINSTAWADGVYVRGAQDSIIESNIISNVRRIGIVLEGQLTQSEKPITINDNVIIRANAISNVFGARGTEYNAGIWIEPYNNILKTSYYKSNRVTIIRNMIRNDSTAFVGTHPQWGIRLGAKENLVSENTIIGFSNKGGVGIIYSFGENILKTNKFEKVRTAISQAADNRNYSSLMMK